MSSLDHPEYAGIERHFMLYPLGTLGTRDTRNILVHESWVTADNGERRKRRWEIRAGQTGLPTEWDEQVLIALMKIAYDRGYDSQIMPVSSYQILAIMGKDTKAGINYQLLEQALERWAEVFIYTKGSFYDAQEQKWTKHKDGWHILNQFSLRSPEAANGEEQATAYIEWSREVWQNLANGYIQLLDVNTYFHLKSPTARRLFKLLSLQLGGREEFEMDIYEVGSRLGLSPYKYASKIAAKLKPAFDELLSIGYLRDVRTVQHLGFTRLKFNRSLTALPVTPAAPPSRRAAPGREETPPLSTEAQRVLAKLRALGIGQRKAEGYIARYEAAYLLAKIQLVEGKKGSAKPRSISGFLIRAIEEDYQVPAHPLDAVRQPTFFSAVEDPVEGTFTAEMPLDPYAPVWKKVLESLELRLPVGTFNHFRGSRLESVTDTHVVFGVRTPAAREWIRNRLYTIVQSALDAQFEAMPTWDVVVLE